MRPLGLDKFKSKDEARLDKEAKAKKKIISNSKNLDYTLRDRGLITK